MDNLFSTHPNTANRIAELERLAEDMGASRGDPGDVAASGGPWSGTSPARRGGPWG